MRTKCNLSAYILLGESTWMSESVNAYYPFVDEIVAVYDNKFRSFTGHDIRSRYEQCFNVLNVIDTDKKVRYVSSNFVAKTNDLMAADTYMRQYALYNVSSVADLVIQIDGDEILPDPLHFLDCITLFFGSEFAGMEYSARWLYTHIAKDWFLERCNRDFSSRHDIPGPLVIRPNQTLTYSRQITEPCLLFEPGGCHGPMSIEQELLHPSMLRSDNAIREKLQFLSGHSQQMRGEKIYNQWKFAKKYPLLYCVLAKLRRNCDVYKPVNLSYAANCLQNRLHKYYY